MVEDLASRPRISAALDNRNVDDKVTMVEIEGNVSNTYISILIDLGSCWRYVSPKIVDTYKLKKVKHEKPWMVQLATGTKRKVSKLVRDCEVDMNSSPTKVDLNILPLGSHNVLIGKD